MTTQTDLAPRRTPIGRYRLSDSERQTLEVELADRYKDFFDSVRASGSPFACLAVDGLDPLADLGRHLEQTVFDEEAGSEPMDIVYAEYENRSIFFLGVDVARRSVSGCLRVVTGTARMGPMVKTLSDVLSRASYTDLGVPHDPSEIDLRDRIEIDPERTTGRLGRHWGGNELRLDRTFVESFHAMEPGEPIFDMATVVIPRSIRQTDAKRLSLLIYSGSWRGARLLNAKHAVTFIRDDLLTEFRQTLGMAWEDLGGLGKTQYVEGDPYLSQPAYAHLDAFHHMLEREYYNRLIGREPKLGPPFASFVQLMQSPACDDLFLLD